MTSRNLEDSFRAFRAPAEEFCKIVDKARQSDPVELLKQLQLFLPLLHAEAVRLPLVELDDSELGRDIPRRPENDWRLLYENLKTALAQYDLYWTVFDSRKHEEQAMYGSLADDLADIYLDVSGPLGAADRGIPVAIVVWELRFGFYSHWGAHLVSASKAIHDHLAEGEY
jgi:hypothetical protein